MRLLLLLALPALAAAAGGEQLVGGPSKVKYGAKPKSLPSIDELIRHKYSIKQGAQEWSLLRHDAM